ncbi:MAG: AAA family ATPase [Verrucomicrobiales bacterium]|nr:AAA family ATPase [Verrucomicrobiales bacterium]
MRVVFGRETLLQRDYAINFVAGINGTGKSTLLRALYTVFRHLDRAKVPPFPVTLVYDADNRRDPQAVLFHYPGKSRSKAFFYVKPGKPWSDRDAEEWDQLAEAARKREGEATFVSGDALSGNNVLREFLPGYVLAYTSGIVDEWDRVGQPVFPEEELPDSREIELPEEFPASALFRRGFAAEAESPEAEASPSVGAASWPVRIPPLGRCRLLTDSEIKLAGVAFGIWHAFMEFTGAEDERSQERARHQPLCDRRPEVMGSARSLVDKMDWLWPTHLSLLMNLDVARLSAGRQAQLLVLMALADAGISQPGKRGQLVLPLSALGRRDVGEKLTTRFREGKLPPMVKEIADRIGRAPNGAEALCRLCHPEPNLWATFETLHQWHLEGLLVDATLTVRRSTDNGVIVYEGLSDGERMLLGRMALLFLLQQRDGSLLLLDEPETHFNDFWKREIVDVIHDSLKRTAVQVLVATHSSITLSDAFSAEVALLEKHNDGIQAMSPPIPTLGEEPGEIMVRLFGAPETIGQRAAEWLDGLIRQPWKPEQREELERIIQRIGAGYYRSELRAALRKLQYASPHSTPA